MRIEFMQTSQTSVADKEQIQTEYRSRSQAMERQGSGYHLDISGKVMDNAAFGLYSRKGEEEGQGKTIEDCLQGIQGQNMPLIHNYMAVMSNSLSAEDYNKLSQDGFHVGSLPVDETVTVVDQIKVKLAESGVTIAGYNDNLSSDTLRAVTGNEGRTAHIRQALMRNDLPVTEENEKEANQALQMADELAAEAEKAQESGLSQDCLRYMISSGVEPTLENVYMAQYGSQASRVRPFSAQELSQLQGQMEQVITKADLEVSEKSMSDAKWLLENGLPLNEDTISELTDLKKITLPLQEDDLLNRVADALSRGHKGVDANLIHRERIFEEVRLSMTTEANRMLSGSDFSLDTEALQAKVESLKVLENKINEYNGKQDVSFDNLLSTANELADNLRDIWSMPVAMVGKISTEVSYSLTDVYEHGTDLAIRYKEAGNLYEALRTEVRTDLGDSMKKAFQNVDDILRDMNMEVNAVNERAVRILGYNQMEISASSINQVKEADGKLRHVLDALNPSAVLKLIRQGVNPLTRTVEELSADLKNNTSDSDTEDKYSQFLWKLEKNGAISEEEKQSFIGIYRLFRQVEKSDGAVIGSLVNSGSEITVKNLISAVRSRKAKGMDYTVDDDFGGLSKIISADSTITEQIEAAFTPLAQSAKSSMNGNASSNQDDSQRGLSGEDADYQQILAADIFSHLEPSVLKQMLNAGELTGDTNLETMLYSMVERETNPVNGKDAAFEALDDQYNQQMAAEIRRVMSSEDAVVKALVEYEEPVTMDSLQAAAGLIFNRGGLAKGLHNLADAKEKELFLTMAEAFEDEDTAKDAYDRMFEKAEEILARNTESQTISYEKLRDLRMLGKEIRLAHNLSKQENYEVPVEIDGSITSVNLKIIHGLDEPSVSATFYSEDYGAVSFKMSLDGEKATGYLVCGNDYGEDFLNEKAVRLSEKLTELGFDTGEIPVMRKQGLKLSEITAVNPNRKSADEKADSSEGKQAASESKQAVSSKNLYRASKAFLQVIQED